MSVRDRPVSRFVARAVAMWRDADRIVRISVITSLGFLAGASVLTGLAPLALQRIVDAFAGGAGAHGASMPMLVVLYVTCLWLSRVLGELRSFCYSFAEKHMSRRLSEKLFSHLMHLSLRFHLERSTGAVVQTLENGLQGYRSLTYHLVFTLFPVAIELATIVAVFLYFGHLEFLLLFALATVFYGITFTVTSRRVAARARGASDAKIQATGTMTDGVMNYESVKYFTAEETVIARTAEALIRSQSEAIRFHRSYTSGMLLVAVVFAGFILVTALLGVHQVGAGLLSVGGFVLVNTYMIQLARPIEMLGNAVQNALQGAALLEKMLALLEVPRETDEFADVARGAGPGQLTIENLSFSYEPGRDVLKDVSLTVPAGGMTGIVGVSGSGKSTLVRLILRLLEPGSGRILLDGVPIQHMSRSSLRQAIAVVPQELALFNDSIGYNIALGRAGSTQDDVVRAARIAQLHNFVQGLPNGYDTPVGERGQKLSGGERQRIAIARAVLKNAVVYIFDEATSSLDNITEREILTSLRHVARQTTTLVIAHRLSTIIDADEIVLLHDGAVVERGTHAQLLALDRRYAALWRAQRSAEELLRHDAEPSERHGT